MPLIQANGIALYVEDTGSGSPLLLITGAGSNTVGWGPLFPVLQERFRVIAFDNRGAGRSSAPPGPYTTRQMADDAAALLDHLGIPRAHVLGHSLGGMIAQEVALAYPERVERLVLVATLACPRPGFWVPWSTFLVQAAERGLDPAGSALWLMPWMFTPTFMAQHDVVEAALAASRNDPYPTPAHGLAAQAAAGLAHDTRSRLPQIATPTLVLVGAEDIITPVSDARELAAGIPARACTCWSGVATSRTLSTWSPSPTRSCRFSPVEAGLSTPAEVPISLRRNSVCTWKGFPSIRPSISIPHRSSLSMACCMARGVGTSTFSSTSRTMALKSMPSICVGMGTARGENDCAGPESLSMLTTWPMSFGSYPAHRS
jgi:3-oxoadipate enol-lactonase